MPVGLYLSTKTSTLPPHPITRETEKSIRSINPATDIAVDISMLSSSSFINDILAQTNLQFNWRAIRDSQIFPKYLPQLLFTRLTDINNDISQHYW
jgi:hypothetical protein